MPEEKKKLTAAQKRAVAAAEAALWGAEPYEHDDGGEWHADAVRWYKSLRTIDREWSVAEVAHAMSIAEDLSMYKQLIPRNAAAMKVIYTEMKEFLTTPKAFDEAQSHKAIEEDVFSPDVDMVGSFFAQMRFGAKPAEETRSNG